MKLLVATGVVGGLVMAPWIGWNLVRFNDPTFFSIARAPCSSRPPATRRITARASGTGNRFDYRAAAEEAGVPRSSWASICSS